MANAKARVDEIDAERASYAARLAAGQVPPDELRLRAFGESEVKHLELPLDGIIFYRIETYGPKSWVILRDLRKQLFALPYDARIEPLFNGVYDIARKIPPGKTMTYGEIAKKLGGVELSRDVGQALGRNPCPIVVPCHRVVAADGLGGYSGGTGPELKRWLLTLEGAVPPTLDWNSASLRA